MKGLLRTTKAQNLRLLKKARAQLQMGFHSSGGRQQILKGKGLAPAVATKWGTATEQQVAQHGSSGRHVTYMYKHVYWAYNVGGGVNGISERKIG